MEKLSSNFDSELVKQLGDDDDDYFAYWITLLWEDLKTRQASAVEDHKQSIKSGEKTTRQHAAELEAKLAEYGLIQKSIKEKEKLFYESQRLEFDKRQKFLDSLQNLAREIELLVDLIDCKFEGVVRDNDFYKLIAIRDSAGQRLKEIETLKSPNDENLEQLKTMEKSVKDSLKRASVKEFIDSELEQLEERFEVLAAKEELYEERLRELKTKEKQLEVVKKKYEERLKEFEWKEQRLKELAESLYCRVKLVAEERNLPPITNHPIFQAVSAAQTPSPKHPLPSSSLQDSGASATLPGVS